MEMKQAQPAKKRRLSMACNECRRRKVKCDATYPQCGSCKQRNSECFTSDPKRPGIPVIREWLEDQRSSSTPGLALVDSRRLNQNDDPVAASQTSPGTSRETPIMTGTAELSQATSETTQVSPVYHPYDMSFQAEHRTNRIKMMGGSSSQCLIKSLDLYLGTANIKPVSPCFQHGMRHTEEVLLPLVLNLPPVPAADVHCVHVDAYFKRIHVLWPMLDIDETKNAINHFASVSNLSSTPHDQIPLLASAYLVLSLGVDEEARSFTSVGEKYLHAAAGLLGHVVLVPYLHAVQALLLFAIAYRGRNKDGLGWQTVGMAVRIAHTLGLHRHSAIKPSDQHGVTQRKEQLFHARVWAVCCCLEKMLQLESGRPSAIVSVNRDQMMGQAQRAPGHDFLQWNMGLAEYQSEISQHIYGHKPGERTARDILLNAARLDRALLAWSNQVPAEFQPTSVLFCSNEDLHLAAFLSIQFHQSMIALHRAALIAPTSTFDAEVERHCSEEPSKFRLKRGALICAESARAIIRLSLEAQESKAESRIFSAGPPLLACAALSILLMKNPRGKAQAADLELLRAGVEFTSDQFIKSGQDRRMAQGIATIHDKIRLHFRQTLATHKRLRDVAPSGAQSQVIVETSPADRIDCSDNERSPTRRSLHSVATGPQPAYSDVTGTATAPVSNIVNCHDYSNSTDTFPPAMQDMYNKDPSNSTGWKPVSPDQSFLQSGSGDNLSDSLVISQDVFGRLDPERLPFGEYNTEELWNWMFFMDSDESMQVIVQGSL